MTKVFNRISFVVISVFLFVIAFALTPVASFADQNSFNTQTVGSQTTNQTANNDGIAGKTTDEINQEANKINSNGNIPSVQANQVNAYVNKKGGDVISVVRNVAIVVDIIFFFIFLVMLLVGSIGGHGGVGKAIFGLCITAGTFVAITYGTQLLAFVSSWATP